MNPEVKAMWLKALRSGRYKQTVAGALRSTEDGGYCCLGVLCAIAVKEKIIPRPRKNDGDARWTFAGAEEFLPSSVQAWAGLTEDPGLDGVDQFGDETHEEASGWNDAHHADFGQIANMIEATL